MQIQIEGEITVQAEQNLIVCLRYLSEYFHYSEDTYAGHERDTVFVFGVEAGEAYLSTQYHEQCGAPIIFSWGQEKVTKDFRFIAGELVDSTNRRFYAE